MHLRLPLWLLAATTFCAAAANAQPARIDHLEPPFWWTGMQHKKLQLMVHGPGIGDLAPAVSYPGVRVDKVTRVANKNYLFIDLQIGAAARPGRVQTRV